MTNHEEYTAALSAFLDGELTDAEREALLAHLRECNACRTRLAELTAMREALRDENEYDPPAGFAAGVTARLRAERAAAQRRRTKRVWLGLAACLAVAVLGAGILPQALRMGRKSATMSASGSGAAPESNGAVYSVQNDALSTTAYAPSGETANGAAGDARNTAETAAGGVSEAKNTPTAAPAPDPAAPKDPAPAEERSAVLLRGEAAEDFLLRNSAVPADVCAAGGDAYLLPAAALRALPEGLTLDADDAERVAAMEDEDEVLVIPCEEAEAEG